jgi:Ca2+-transporting ATPase
MSEIENSLAPQALRPLILAYKDIENDSSLRTLDAESIDRDYLETEMVFLCVIGIEDKIRQGVDKSVKTLQTAGITVRMVTGDYLPTAVAVAKLTNILPENYVYQRGDFISMTGEEFRD